MASDLDARLAELAQAVRERDGFLADPFPILRDIAHLHSNAEEEQLAQLRDILIRALEVRSELGDNTVILDALIAQIGLYPYLNPETLGAAGGIAYESHRPLAETETVFHAKQAEAYRRLMDGENVILSAPTSFGKSLIIDALIASGKYANVVVIVPTIALIDETRRRLSKFRDTHKVITHPSQQLVERNLLILTQERLLDYSDLEIEVDLFVIDEFYKLSPERDPGRSELLNQALYRLWKRSKQFYSSAPTCGRWPEDYRPSSPTSSSTPRTRPSHWTSSESPPKRMR